MYITSWFLTPPSKYVHTSIYFEILFVERSELFDVSMLYIAMDMGDQRRF